MELVSDDLNIGMSLTDTDKEDEKGSESENEMDTTGTESHYRKVVENVTDAPLYVLQIKYNYEFL